MDPTPASVTISRADVLAARWHAQQLDRAPGSAASPVDVAALDLGVQDTGPDGAAWALALRGAPDVRPGSLPPDLALAWTLRGAPHVYRRVDLGDVAVATAPFSEADAAKRVFDASRPLRAAGVAVLDALRTEARLERELVDAPTVKGDLSTRVTERLDEPYLRWCRPCGATHSYEQTFRLAALQAGLELEPGTSPPVLRRIPDLEPPLYARLGSEAVPRLDVVRGYLRFFPAASVQDVAGFLDAPVKEVRTHWPEHAVRAEVADADPGARPAERWVLADDVERLVGAAARLRDARAAGEPVVRLVGPYDLSLQLRDRVTLVPDASRAKDLWRVLGRPGAVLADGEVVGTWRPRASGRRLTVLTDPWVPWDARLTDAVAEQAERLRGFRDAASVTVAPR
ncbi:DNA glycosylase AlkZ-like family protein [Cellulosimicrobium protaetiae]|uniref:Winged helix DNA-binding domain-containing protein n=1 Tax=Cellulosimicrobium protaetiae TaxID=2587808 RepID=A0A6M5UDF9_9MICO|nr:crosslink repair DNA glycosylase YcaQ family protein [Cellulosimicrobium protaetiae]QJW36064.1 winged helix DNA-binding domain-containing protein [Cellulosimicrobium protaetiae]